MGGGGYVGFRSMRCPLGKPCLSFPAPAWHRPPPGFALWGLKSSFWRVSRSGGGGKHKPQPRPEKESEEMRFFLAR